MGFGAPGWTEMIIISVIALLLFGKRLPEVARSLGKGIVEFKKGVSGIEEDVNHSTYSSGPSVTSRPEPTEESEPVTAPKFQPPESAPAETSEQQS